VWEFDNAFAHCHRSPEGGITDTGYDVLQYLDQNKMIIDTANMNYPSMVQAYQFTKKPIMNSHTNILALHQHSRNVADDFLDLVDISSGLIGLSLTSQYMRNDVVASLDDYMAQIRYVKDRIGNDNVAIGTGYHSVYFSQLVTGMENLSSLTVLEKRVIDEFGYKFAGMFFWENAYRFLVETV